MAGVYEIDLKRLPLMSPLIVSYLETFHKLINFKDVFSGDFMIDDDDEDNQFLFEFDGEFIERIDQFHIDF